MEYKDLDDKELYDRLERGALAADFLESVHGKVLAEACRRIVDAEIKKIAYANPTDMAAIIRSQEVIKMYGFKLFDELRLFIMDGENAFEESKDRGSLRNPAETGDTGTTP